MKDPRRVIAGHVCAARRLQDRSRSNYCGIVYHRKFNVHMRDLNQTIVSLQLRQAEHHRRALRQLLRVLDLKSSLDRDLEQYLDWLEVSEVV